jgi:hypothetical protein
VRAALSVFALVLGLLGSLATLRAAGHWQIQYLYDQAGSNFDIRDIACPSVQRCIAAGVISDKKDHQAGAVVVTSDGGAHWSRYDVKETPIALFFLDESAGWMVTDRGLWSTAESGRSWIKVETRKGILQVHFLDPNHGFITGTAGMLDETRDGGKTWARVPEAASAAAADARPVSYGSVTFHGPRGIIIGEIDPSAPLPKAAKGSEAAVRQSLRRQLIVLETVDGGNKWNTGSVHLEADLGRLRISQQGFALALVVYTDARNPLASAVLKVTLGQPVSRMVFGERDRAAVDVAPLDEGGAVVVAIEPPGNSPQVPIPGKLKILKCRDLTDGKAVVWREMDVDYRAVAQAAVLALADDHHIWVATDTGAILGLVEGD